MTDFKDVDEALADLQGVLPVIKKATTGNVGNRPTKYADLADICREILPLTSARGLAWTTRPTLTRHEDGTRELVLYYSLRHAPSGTSIDGEYPLGTGGPQQLGSAITYARRYTFCAVTGVVADEDDDGTAASQPAAGTKPRRESPPRRPKDELPRNTDGSVSRSRTTDAELAAAGNMTDAELRAHNKLARDTQGGSAPAERLTATPADDPWYREPLPMPHASQPLDARIIMHFARFGISDRDVRLGYTARLAGRDTLGSTKDLTAAEGLAVEKALARCKDLDAFERLLLGEVASEA